MQENCVIRDQENNRVKMNDVINAIQAIKDGKLVVPTETVYGSAAPINDKLLVEFLH